MADPSLGVWFELCKGRKEREGWWWGAECFDYFLLEGDDLRGRRGTSNWPDPRLADKSEETKR